MAHNTHCCYILLRKELILKTVSNLKLAKYFVLLNFFLIFVLILKFKNTFANSFLIVVFLSFVMDILRIFQLSCLRSADE